MRKLIYCAATVAALAAGGSALAQGAECNAGSAWGVNPGCGSSNATHQLWPYGVWVDTTRGGLQTSPYGLGPPVAVPPQVIAHGMAVPQLMVPPFRPSARDRDGDGVRNRHDRHPDDPRFR